MAEVQKDTSFLNAIRALAALWVVVMHCFIWGGSNLLGLPDPKDAVDIFMLLTGFLMMHTSERSGGFSNAAAWGRFYIRRLFRIAPAYYLSLAILFALWPLHAGGYETFRALEPERWMHDTVYDPSLMSLDVTNLLLHVTFLFGLHPTYSFSTMLPDWSLSLEMQFYATFPLLFVALRRRVGLTVLAGLASLAFTVAYRKLHLPAFEEPSFLIFKLPIFLAGMLIYESGRDGIKLPALIAASVLLVGEGRFSDSQTSLPFCGLAVLMAACWALPAPRLLNRIMAHDAVTWAADCSYSVYLFHGFFLSVAGSRILTTMLSAGWSNTASVAAMTVAVLAMIYPVSWVIFRYVEEPFNALGKKLARGKMFATPSNNAGAL